MAAYDSQLEADSIATHMSAKSRRSIASLGIFTGAHQGDSTVELISSTHIKTIRRVTSENHLPVFSSLKTPCGSLVGIEIGHLRKTIVLLNVELPDYNTRAKKKKIDQNADLLNCYDSF